MPVEFLPGGQAARYGRFAADPTPEQLARSFLLNGADLALIAERLLLPSVMPSGIQFPMIDLHQYGAFCLAALILAVLPGPGMLYVLARSLGGGRRDGFQSALGCGVGGMVHVVASAVGLSALVLASSLAFSVIKYVGAAYLIYLGIRTLLSREPLKLDAEGVPKQSRVFTQGVMTELLNPKTALFFLALIPQFVDPEAGSVFWQFVLLGTTSVVINTLNALLVAALAGPLGARLKVNARFQRRQRVATGGAMIALGTYVAVQK